MPVITMPAPLREKLGPEAADSLIELLNQWGDLMKGDIIVLVEEKFERRLVEEISKLRVELREEMAGLRADFREEMAELRAEFKVELANTRADLIRWMFIFWVGQVATILGILFVFFRK